MNTALLLIDIQNDYFEGGAMTLAGSLTAGENARKVLEHFRQQQLPIVHIQHLATRPGASFFVPGTEGCMIHSQVAPLPSEHVAVKHYPNSFRETDLMGYLQSRDIDQLVICGMMTHMCIDATTRAAKDLGYDCILIGDACATKDLEIDGKKTHAQDVHNSFLAALSYYYAAVKTTDDFLSNL